MPEAFSAVGLTAMYIALRLRSAVSDAAKDVRQQVCGVVATAERSQTLFGEKRQAISDLWSLVKEIAGEPDVDDVMQRTINIAAANAAEIVKLLPAEIPMPEFAADPDGAISLDWIESRHRFFSVSVGPKNRLPYAWIDGTKRGHGVEVFDGEEVPDRIVTEIKKLNGHSLVGSA